MSHDMYAAWATAEIANSLLVDTDILSLENTDLSIYASKEGRTKWPIADGVILIERNGRLVHEIAIELKRKNEGVHGVLTALGQAHAYLHKGYSGSIIVIPNSYDTHSNPAEHLRDIINYTGDEVPIAIFAYDEPDVTKPSPFRGRIRCVRGINIENNGLTNSRPQSHQNYVKTQWAHLREGSSDSDAFYRYLQTSKHLSVESLCEPSINIATGLMQAVQRLASGADPLKYLSNSIGDSFHDVVWRNFWFNYILTEDLNKIWIDGSSYLVNDVPSRILLPDGSGYKKFFAGRSDSIKNVLVNELNNGAITEQEAWDRFARKIRERAHSYREDIDSGLSHIGLLGNDGKPTDLGYKFVDACERTGNSNSGTPKSLLGSAILKKGNLGAFLHYVYRLSEEKFSVNPLEFTSRSGNGSIQFRSIDYLHWLENELSTNLKVMRKVSVRGGTSRKPFQGELAILRQFNFVDNFRAGAGLKINWPSIQSAYEVEI